MTTAEAWKYRELRRLYTEVMGGCAWIGSEKDAQSTAVILRLLADELDPGKAGGPEVVEKALLFMKTLKELINYRPEG